MRIVFQVNNSFSSTTLQLIQNHFCFMNGLIKLMSTFSNLRIEMCVAIYAITLPIFTSFMACHKFLFQPETVPQARIDMTRVLEVAAAEDVTGHPYSLAVTSPEGVTFVKGTCREETRWWADVLQVYSRNKVNRFSISTFETQLHLHPKHILFYKYNKYLKNHL